MQESKKLAHKFKTMETFTEKDKVLFERAKRAHKKVKQLTELRKNHRLPLVLYPYLQCNRLILNFAERYFKRRIHEIMRKYRVQCMEYGMHHYQGFDFVIRNQKSIFADVPDEVIRKLR